MPLPLSGPNLMLRRLFLICLVIPALTVSLIAETPKPAREPVAVAYFSSIDGVLDDVDYIVTTGGQPQLSQMVKGFLTNLNNLDGIDRAKPMGAFAFVPLDLSGGKKDPDIVGFIPVTNIEALQKTAHLSNVLSLEATDKPNRYEFKTPEKTLFVLFDQGHLFVTDKADLLDLPLPAPAALTEVLGGQYDLVIQLRREGVPKLVWDFALIGAMAASDKELRKLKQSREPDDLAKTEGIELGRAAFKSVMGEVRSVWLGVKISRESRTAVIDAKLQFTDSGKVSKALAQSASSPSLLAKVATADVPAAVHLHAALPSDVRNLAAEAFRLARAKQDPTESIPEPQRTSVNSLIDVVEKTIAAGQADLLLQLTGEPQTGMTAVVGIHVEESQKLSEAIMKLLPEARNSDKVSEVTLDAGAARGIHFARIDGKVSEGESDGKKEELFYGGKPSLYIGTEASTLWLVVGDQDALTDFGSLADGTSTSADRSTIAAFGQAHLHLSDWLGLLGQAEDQKTREFTAAARKAVKDPDHDALRFVLRPESDGLRLTLTIDEAYLILIGAAVGKK